MSTFRIFSPQAMVTRLEALAQVFPHRPARERADRFVLLTPTLTAALDRSTPEEDTLILVAATRAAAAIIGTGHLESDDHARLTRYFTSLLERYIPRLGPREIKSFFDHIRPTLRDDHCGVLPIVAGILAWRLDPAQLMQFDRDLRELPVAMTDAYYSKARNDRIETRLLLARITGNAIEYLKLSAECRRQDPRITAEVMLRAGRASEAQDLLDHALGDRRQCAVTDRLRADILMALGATEQAQDLRRQCFQRELCAGALTDYLHHLPDFDDIVGEEQAMSYALDHPSAGRAIWFFLRMGRHDLAADRIMRDPAQWDAVDDWYQDEAGDHLAEHQPLAASILLRGRVSRILQEMDKWSYLEARLHLKYLENWARLADADNRRPAGYLPHADWITELRERMWHTGFFRRAERDVA